MAKSMHKMDDVGQTRSYVRNEHLLLIRECFISNRTTQCTLFNLFNVIVDGERC